MFKVKAKIRCQVNGKFYEPGEDIEVDKIEHVNKLNEIGFVEPLTAKEIQEMAEPKKTMKRGDF